MIACLLKFKYHLRFHFIGLVTHLLAIQIAFSQVTLQEPKAIRYPPLIELSAANYIPFLIEYNFATRRKARFLPISVTEAESKYEQVLKVAKKNLESADRTPLPELYQNFQLLLDLYLFFGKFDFSLITRERVNVIRNLCYQLGEWIYLKENDPEKRKLVRLSYLPFGIPQSAYQAEAIHELILMEKEMPSSFGNAVGLLKFFNLTLSSHTLATAKPAIQKTYRSFSRYEKQVVALILARLDAGLINDRPMTQAKPATRQSLSQLSQKASGHRYDGIKQRIDATLLDTWIKINQTVDWRQVPLANLNVDSAEMPLGLKERIILQEVQGGKLDRAILFYEAHAKEFDGQDLGVNLHLRRLQLVKAESEKSKKLDRLQALYLELIEKFKPKAGAPVEKAKRIYASLFHDYQASVMQYLKLSLAQPSDTQLKTAAKEFARFFLAKYDQYRALISPSKEKLAEFYFANREFKESADLYRDLAKDKALQFLPLAIKAQFGHAKWPENPPWEESLAKERHEERLALIPMIENFMQQKTQNQEGQDWAFLAQLGLLYRYHQQPEKAAQLWRTNLQATTNQELSHGVFGILMKEGYEAKNWSEVIDVFRLAEQKNIVPTYANRPFQSQSFYQAALLQRARSFQESKDFQKALFDYSTFATAYPNDTRRPAVMVQISQLNWQLGQRLEAFQTIRRTIEQYPDHPLTKKLLLEGALWAQANKDGSDLEVAEEFYQLYLDRYTSEPKAFKVRYLLAEVQGKRGRNQEAAMNYRTYSLDDKADDVTRVRAALHYIQLIPLVGEPAEGIGELAEVLRKANEQDKDDYLSAHIVLAKLAADRLDLAQMAIEETILSPLVSERREVLEVIGLIRFKRTENQELAIPFPQTTETAETYVVKLENIYQKYNEIREIYDNVCAIGENSYCYQAYRRTAQFAQEAMDAVGSLMVDQQVPKETLSELRTQQATYLNRLNESFKEYGKKIKKYERYEAPILTKGLISAH